MDSNSWIKLNICKYLKVSIKSTSKLILFLIFLWFRFLCFKYMSHWFIISKYLIMIKYLQTTWERQIWIILFRFLENHHFAFGNLYTSWSLENWVSLSPVVQLKALIIGEIMQNIYMLWSSYFYFVLYFKHCTL